VKVSLARKFFFNRKNAGENPEIQKKSALFKQLHTKLLILGHSYPKFHAKVTAAIFFEQNL
jgi:hypothetical protein